jgi:hypothetical protein
MTKTSKVKNMEKTDQYFIPKGPISGSSDLPVMTTTSATMVRTTMFFDRDQAVLMQRASTGMVPAVHVELIEDPEIAAQAHTLTALNENTSGYRISHSRTNNPSEWADLARQAVMGGKVLVQFTAKDGIMNLAPLYSRAEALAAEKVE